MVDDLRDAPVIERGTKAEKLLKDPLLTECYELVKQALIAKWESSPVRDKDGREYLYLMIKATNDARGYLDQAVRDGKIAISNRAERSRLSKIFGR